MPQNLLKDVLETVREWQMILPGDRLAVACSGGPDSTALLLVLHELSLRLGCTLRVCHLNHLLRGEQSEGDESFVRELARQLDLPVCVERADARAQARQEGANLEAKARQLRYGFFLSLLHSGQAVRVAVGHTADDQAETVVHRFLRGAGTSGLAGIYPVAEGRIIRPLLRVRRREVLAWLRARGQAWRDDSSNQDLARTRNRIRQRLLPQLVEFNPQLVQTLAGTADVAREEESFWQEFLRPLLRDCLRREPGRVVLETSLLRGQPKAVIRRALRAAVAECAVLSVPSGEQKGAPQAGFRAVPAVFDFRQMERLLDLVFGRSGRVLALPNKIRARKEFSHLIFESIREGREEGHKEHGALRGAAAAFCYRAEAPGTVEVPEIARSFVFQLIRLPAGKARYNKEGGVLLDARIASAPLTLRSWRPGDAYCPAGHHRRRKLKEWFQRQRVPASQRLLWPVLLAGECIVWARGFPVAEGFLPAPASREAVLLEERELPL